MNPFRELQTHEWRHDAVQSESKNEWPLHAGANGREGRSKYADGRLHFSNARDAQPEKVIDSDPVSVQTWKQCNRSVAEP
jgi:hypothetical protein